MNANKMSEQIKSLKVKDIFNSGNDQYQIPIYQRNYAWKEPQIRQLIQDIYDYAKDNIGKYESKQYYIGTLVVRSDKENAFEVIDGQQRLTTLSMLVAYLNNTQDPKNSELKNTITFQCRHASTNSLNKIWDNLSNDYDATDPISAGYQILKKSFEDIVKGKEIFKKYLLENVIIYRISVPQDTDLNHYFEIMNTRGEQLEKHEILKARLLALENKACKREFYSRIWDACSDMGKYLRLKTLSPHSQNKTLDQGKKQENSNIPDFTISGIIKKPGNNNAQNNSTEDRYRSIINFPNFLLIVLKLMDDEFHHPTVLDDKKLLDEFDKIKSKSSNENSSFIKDFFKKLLTTRFLFDNYVIKRELASGKWILKSLIKKENKNGEPLKNTFDNDSENKQILMLLSMFEVSFPNYSYKSWLFDILKDLAEQACPINLWDIYYNNPNCFKIEAGKYLDFLEGCANKKRDEYACIENTDNVELDYVNFKAFDKGTAVPNFIFNSLDYKLWKKEEAKYKDFEFTYRDSVEHFYPQNPISGESVENVDSFGNLCLITSEMNSRLNNLPPLAKKDIWKDSKAQPSIKLSKMLEPKEWDENAIRSHKREMLEILFDDRNPQNLKNR